MREDHTVFFLTFRFINNLFLTSETFLLLNDFSRVFVTQSESIVIGRWDSKSSIKKCTNRMNHSVLSRVIIESNYITTLIITLETTRVFELSFLVLTSVAFKNLHFYLLTNSLTLDLDFNSLYSFFVEFAESMNDNWTCFTKYKLELWS